MKALALPTIVALAAFASPALANDTMATLGTGGLEFVTTDQVEMAAEYLSISPKQVTVVYKFKNDAAVDQHVLVAFPLPDITGSGDFMVAIPNQDSDNIFGFKTTLDGKPLEATLHQNAFAFGIDETAYLKQLGVPLAPFGEATQKAIDALPKATQQRMEHLGLVINMDDSDVPVWTLKSAYTWEADFPANQTVTVTHSYAPSVGGTVAATFLSPPAAAGDEDRPAEYRQKYCTDDDFIRSVKKTLKDPSDLFSAPYTENWLSYVWSTGDNWNGPIHDFRLTIDKGDLKALISFCWDGKVTKTGPTTFSMQATDFSPPQQNLEILLLNPNNNTGG